MGNTAGQCGNKRESWDSTRWDSVNIRGDYWKQDGTILKYYYEGIMGNKAE